MPDTKPTINTAFTIKSYGPYIKNGKQFWRNYHREIKRTDAKSFLEIQYLELPDDYKPFYG
jgi:hypothetical protein